MQSLQIRNRNIEEESEDTIACWKRREEEVIEHLHTMRFARHSMAPVTYPIEEEEREDLLTLCFAGELEGGEIVSEPHLNKERKVKPPQHRSSLPEKRHADWPLEKPDAKKARKDHSHAAASSESNDESDKNYGSKNRPRRSKNRPDDTLWIPHAIRLCKEGYNLKSIIVKLEQEVPAFMDWVCQDQTKIIAVKAALKTAFDIKSDVFTLFGTKQVPKPRLTDDYVLSRLRKLRTLYEKPNPPPVNRWRLALREPGLNEYGIKEQLRRMLFNAHLLGDCDLFNELLIILKVLGGPWKDVNWCRTMAFIEKVSPPTQQKPDNLIPTKKPVVFIDLTIESPSTAVEKKKLKPVVVDFVEPEEVVEDAMDVVEHEEVYDAEVIA